MRSIQQIFNAVIDADHYCPETPYMCIAIDDALDENVLTCRERDEARDAIKHYQLHLDKTSQNSLHQNLHYAFGKRYPDIDAYSNRFGKLIFDTCVVIYKDWENRPRNPEHD